MATIAEMVVRLLADTSNFNASMDEAAAKVTASNDAMAASMATSMQSFRDFDAITKQSVQSTEGLAQAQAALQAAQSSGAFTAEELAAKESLVSAALKKVQADADASAFSLAKITNNSRTMYSASALATDLMTGQFSRSRREVAALANETGLFGGALRALLGPAGLAVTAIAAIGAAAIEANKDIEEMERSLVESGNFAGATTDQMATLAQRLANGGTDITTASEAIKALAASGQVSHDALENAARGVADFSFVTQDKIGEAVKVMVELGKDPVKASAKLNESLNYLTAAQFDQINSLEKQGKQTEAANLAQQVFANAMHTRATQMAGYAGTVEKAWKAAWETVSGHGEVQQSEASHTMQTRIAAIKEELDFLAAHGNREKNTLAPGGVSQDPVSEAYVAQLKQEKANLEAELALVNGAAQKMGDAAAKVRDHIQQAMHPGKKDGTHGNDEADFEAAEYAAIQRGDAMTLAEKQAWWQKRLAQDKAGGDAEAENARQATAKLITIENEIANKRAANQAKALASAKHTADMLTRYNEQAARDFQDDINKEADARQAADEQSVESAHNVATARIAASLQGFKLEAKEGQISAAQLLRDQISALNDQLAADIRYYQAKEKLAAGDAAEQMKWHAMIATDQIKTEAEMVKAAKAYQEAMDQINREIADQKVRDDQRIIESGFREVNAVLTRQESLKSALANLGMQIVEHEEENLARSIAAHFVAEQSKTAATVMGNAERVAADQVGQAQSLLVQGEAAVKWIMTEAAKAAAGAFNAMVSIPYVGPFLAVGASVAAFAAVSKLVSSVASAEGGWERVPADGMLTELHRNEMVLPAHVADPVRKMAQSGGGGGNSYHFHSFDSRGIFDYARRRPSEFAAAMKFVGSRGHL